MYKYFGLKGHLGEKNWQIIFNKWIGVYDGLVEVLVQNLPRQREPTKVFDFQVDEGR